MTAETSAEAQPTPSASALVRARILRFLVARHRTTHRPSTADEVYERLRPQSTPSSVRTRIVELSKLGLVVACDERGVTSTGRRCRRYIATNAGCNLASLAAAESDNHPATAALALKLAATWRDYERAPLADQRPVPVVSVVATPRKKSNYYDERDVDCAIWIIDGDRQRLIGSFPARAIDADLIRRALR